MHVHEFIFDRFETLLYPLSPDWDGVELLWYERDGERVGGNAEPVSRAIYLCACGECQYVAVFGWRTKEELVQRFSDGHGKLLDKEQPTLVYDRLSEDS